MRTIIDLVCVPPFLCRATLFSSRVTADEICPRLEETCGTHVQLDGDHLSLQLVEPLELVAAARQLSAAKDDGFSLRAFAATSCAMELLRETCEPTRSAWQWVGKSLALELPEDVGTFVAGDHAGYVELESDFEDFLARPVLVLDSLGAAPGVSRSVIDRDRTNHGTLVFERQGDGWFVKEHPNGRSRWSSRRGGVSDRSQLRVNGFSVEAPFRVTTGDRVSGQYNECDVWAII